MEVLVLDGKDYVKVTKAARDLGYTTDYVGQLCRSGQIDAHLIGRTWYVNQDELSTHKVEKKRISRAKAREHAKRTIEEYRQKSTQKEKTSKNIAIQYETDSNELIPAVRKLSVETDAPQRKKADYGNLEEGDTLLVEHKGEKVIMQGALEVVDVTDGVVDAGTTILTPKIQRKRHTEESEPDETEPAEEIAQKPNFLSRLAENGIEQPEEPEEIEDLYEQQQTEDYAESTELTHGEETRVRPVESQIAKGSVLPYIFALVLITSMSIGMLCVSKILTYDYIKRPSVSESFSVSYAKTIEILKLKI